MFGPSGWYATSVTASGEPAEPAGEIDSCARERALGHEFRWHVLLIDRVDLYNVTAVHEAKCLQSAAMRSTSRADTLCGRPRR